MMWCPWARHKAQSCRYHRYRSGNHDSTASCTWWAWHPPPPVEGTLTEKIGTFLLFKNGCFIIHFEASGVVPSYWLHCHTNQLSACTQQKGGLTWRWCGCGKRSTGTSAAMTKKNQRIPTKALAKKPCGCCFRKAYSHSSSFLVSTNPFQKNMQTSNWSISSSKSVKIFKKCELKPPPDLVMA